MAFKTVKSYNEDKFGGYFLLRNDGDYQDVIFLYNSADDVLVADVHYIKSAEYSGYVHCCQAGCPACARGIRTQTKLFIPLYNINSGEIEYFDRTMRFEPQLQKDVFSKYPNPSEYVFRITRHGVAGDVNTTYEIVAVGKNTVKSYAQILAENNTSMPAHYENICKEVTVSEMTNMLNSGDKPGNGYSANTDYVPTPRQESAPTPEISDVPDISTEEFATEPTSEEGLPWSNEPSGVPETDDINISEELTEEPQF